METIGTTMRKTLGALALVAILPVSGWAFGGPGMGGRFQGPPQEAFDACKGKKAGDEVRFTTPRGDNVAAICREFDGKLAAAPGRGPGIGGRGMGRGIGMGPERHFDRIADNLDLTAEQKGQIGKILDAEREKSEALRNQLRETRERLRKVTAKTPLDEGAVRKLSAEQEKARVDRILSRTRARNEVYALLTPEQKEQAGKQALFGMDRGKDRGKGHGMGRGMGRGTGRPDCPMGR